MNAGILKRRKKAVPDPGIAPERMEPQTGPTRVAAPGKSLSRVCLYWLLIAAPVAAQVWLTYAIWTPPAGEEPTVMGHVVTWGQAIWFLPAFWAATNLWGMLRHGPPADETPGGGPAWDPDVLLVVAYVSRGQNQLALKRAAEQTRAALRACDVRHVLEFVTDVPVAAENRLALPEGEAVYHLVPADYETPNRTRYKARALQYLLERRTERLARGADRNVWVLHLDEESVVSPECVKGVAAFVAEHDLRSSPGAIGQGEILYNAYAYAASPVITAIDAVRTGDDLGRFRLQFGTFGRPPFGMHGSFVLVPAAVEERVTWDFGARGAVTEDAYFSLVAMEQGVRFGWVEGFLREQSPFTIRDLVQQRRRWYSGLALVATDPRLSLRSTAVLRAFLFFWQCSWVACFFTVFAACFAAAGGRIHLSPWAVAAVGLLSGASAATYSLGAWRNALHAGFGPARQAKTVVTTYILWLLMIPAVVESYAVLYAILRPVSVFHVVEKNRLRRGDARTASSFMIRLTGGLTSKGRGRGLRFGSRPPRPSTLRDAPARP